MKRIIALLVGVIILFGTVTVASAEQNRIKYQNELATFSLLPESNSINSVLIAFAGQYSNDDLEKAIIESDFTLYGYEPQDYYSNGTTVFPQISEDGSFWSGSMRALYEAYSADKIDNYYKVDFIGKNAIVENQVLALYLVPENVSGPDGSISNEKRVFTPLYGGEYGVDRPYHENWWLINAISTITLEHNSDGGAAETTDVKWGSALFANAPGEYNNDLAVTLAVLSSAAYDGNNDGHYILQALNKLGFISISLYSYANSPDNQPGSPFADGTYAFSIAHQPMTVNGESVNLIAIVLRGTNGAEDFSKDIDATHKNQFGYEVHSEFYDFSYDISQALAKYLNRYPELQSSKNIGLITGHSFGAAGANMFAAQYAANNGTSFDGGLYAYTFATPNTYWESKKSALGNVAFNIVNTSDVITVIPNAGTGGLGTQWGKFGKTYWFNGGGWNPSDAHDMNLYIKYMNNLSNEQFPTASKIFVNGKEVVFEAYNIGGNNYFKLRDLAAVLNGTEKQFSVGWNEASNSITLTSGQGYSAVGGEMTSKGIGSTIPTWTDSKITLDGNEASFTAYNLDGNNYFKLRDIGTALDFAVEWDGARNTIVIDTSRGYTVE